MKSIFTKIGNMKVKTALFYACYLLFIVSAMTRCIIGFSDIANVLSMISMALLCVMGLMSLFRMPRKKALVIVFITGIVVLTRILSGVNTFLFLWLFVISAKGIKFDRILRYDLMIKIPLLIIVPLCYFAGLTEVNVHIRDGVIRHSMGFSNPNVFSTYLMSVVAEFLYLRRDKINFGDIVLSIGAMLLVNYFADSRTQMISIAALGAVFCFIRIDRKKKCNTKYKKNKHLFSFLVNYSSFFLMGLSLLLSFSYMNNFSEKTYTTINAISSGRVKAAVDMLDKYDVTPFGQEIKIVTSAQSKKTGESVQNLDNVYMYMLLAFGVVPTGLFCYFVSRYMRDAELKSSVVRYIMLIYLICGLMEHLTIEFQFNIFLLCFADLIYSVKRGEVDSNTTRLLLGRNDE